MNQKVELPLTQISNEIPILNPYQPLQVPSELQGNVFDDAYHQHQNAFFKSFYRPEGFGYAQGVSISAAGSYHHPQQELMREGFSRLAELNYDAPQHEQSMTPAYREASVALLPIEYEERIKTSIKFQDRNKKLDFKVNFRDENRKVNGCFHREESKSPNNSALAFAVAPPKKKWIRHYLTGNEGAGRDFLTCVRECKEDLRAMLAQAVTLQIKKSSWEEISLH